MSAPNYHDFERIAMSYVLGDDVWPIFVRYVNDYAVSDAARMWDGSDPGLNDLRIQWVRHSSQESVRAMEPLLARRTVESDLLEDR